MIDPRDLIAVGLAAAGEYGFALGGGQAVQAHRIVARVSDDVDLFAPYDRRSELQEAGRRVADAYCGAGYAVSTATSSDTYVRLWIADPGENPVADPNGEAVKVELVATPLSHPPVRMDVGPVLHRDDVATGKVAALASRAEARDYIDVSALVTGGHYTREELLRLAEADDAGFDRRAFAGMLDGISRFADDDFLYYGIAADQLATVRADIAAWRRELTS